MHMVSMLCTLQKAGEDGVECMRHLLALTCAAKTARDTQTRVAAKKTGITKNQLQAAKAKFNRQAPFHSLYVRHVWPCVGWTVCRCTYT